MLTPTNRTPSGRVCRHTRSSPGASARHGSHQDAQKLSTTTAGGPGTASYAVPSSSRPPIRGTGRRRAGGTTTIEPSPATNRCCPASGRGWAGAAVQPATPPAPAARPAASSAAGRRGGLTPPLSVLAPTRLRAVSTVPGPRRPVTRAGPSRAGHLAPPAAGARGLGVRDRHQPVPVEGQRREAGQPALPPIRPVPQPPSLEEPPHGPDRQLVAHQHRLVPPRAGPGVGERGEHPRRERGVRLLPRGAERVAQVPPVPRRREHPVADAHREPLEAVLGLEQPLVDGHLESEPRGDRGRRLPGPLQR